MLRFARSAAVRIGSTKAARYPAAAGGRNTSRGRREKGSSRTREAAAVPAMRSAHGPTARCKPRHCASAVVLGITRTTPSSPVSHFAPSVKVGFRRSHITTIGRTVVSSRRRRSARTERRRPARGIRTAARSTTTTWVALDAIDNSTTSSGEIRPATDASCIATISTPGDRESDERRSVRSRNAPPSTP